MGVALYAQETTINIMCNSDTAKIYTSDRTVMTRLDRLAEREDCPDWKVVEEIHDTEGELVG